MNDRQIYELVHQLPRIRATEIAKTLNVDLLTVSNALRSLVDVGDLVKHKEFDDQGRQAQVYELSDAFKKSREFKELLVATPPSSEVAKPEVDTSKVVSAPAPATEAPKEKRKYTRKQPKQSSDVHDQGSAVRVGNVIVATRDSSQVDPNLVAQLAGAAPAAPPTAARTICAIWSDGTYEVKTNGATVALLTHEQARALLTFVERMGAA